MHKKNVNVNSEEDNNMEYQCCCCFETIDLNNAISCSAGHVSGHVTCTDCLTRAIEVAVGDQKTLKCFHESKCNNYYTENAIRKSTDDTRLRRAYDNVVARKNIQEAGITDMYGCPFCNNAVIIDDEEFDVFSCDSCKKNSCKTCKKEQHDGPCDPKRRLEEEQTNNLILICFCEAKLVRGDGCNHLTCPNCRTHWCWICKANLTGPHKYNYFHQQNGIGSEYGVCPVYGDRAINQVFAERPAVIPKKRKNMLTELEPTQPKIVVGGPCERPLPIPVPVPVPVPVLEGSQQPICKGKLRIGEKCTKNAKFDGYCGFHKVK